MKDIYNVTIDNEKIYLKKDFLGWHTTNPVKIDGKYNLKNLIAGGSWIKLIMIIVFVIIMILAIVEYTSSLKYCSQLIAEKMAQSNMVENYLKPIK